jgi:hypothetical protein
MMAPRFLLQVAGATLLLTGGWWFLLGSGLVDEASDSFIAGDGRFVWIGLLSFAAGVAVLYLAGRTRR